jgi:endonuclease YncB( thermonuclease family)
MSRHWRPDFTVIDGYGARPKPKVRGGAAVLLLGAVFAGLAGGLGWQWWTAPPASTGPSSAIEWNAVQAVPTRAPDAEDVAWEKRAEEQDRPSTSSGRTDVGVIESSGGEQGAAVEEMYAIDGDTFDLNGERIRVAGIDAPETHPSRCPREAEIGSEATQKLAELLRGGTLWISGNKTDRYGRSVRTVRVNGEDVAEAMIGSGLARS